MPRGKEHGPEEVLLSSSYLLKQVASFAETTPISADSFKGARSTDRVVRIRFGRLTKHSLLSHGATTRQMDLHAHFALAHLAWALR